MCLILLLHLLRYNHELFILGLTSTLLASCELVNGSLSPLARYKFDRFVGICCHGELEVSMQLVSLLDPQYGAPSTYTVLRVWE